MRERIGLGRLILRHEMTIHYDRNFYIYGHNNNLLNCNPLIVYIWQYVCVLLHIPVCVIKVHVRYAFAYSSILLMYSLNNKKILHR